MKSAASATTTVRLNADERELLDDLAREFGSQSKVIKQGIRVLSEQRQRQRAIQGFMDDWVAESGQPDPDGVASMAERYFTSGSSAPPIKYWN